MHLPASTSRWGDNTPLHLLPRAGDAPPRPCLIGGAPSRPYLTSGRRRPAMPADLRRRRHVLPLTRIGSAAPCPACCIVSGQAAPSPPCLASGRAAPLPLLPRVWPTAPCPAPHARPYVGEARRESGDARAVGRRRLAHLRRESLFLNPVSQTL
jgi:hypothetical protein